MPTAIQTAADASIVKGMFARGDRQHDIAAWFGVNAGRIAEIKTGANKRWRDVPPAPSHALPPPGPYSYFTPREGMPLAEQFQQALAAQDLKWAQALAEIREELRHGAHERRQTNEMLVRVMRQLLESRRAAGEVEKTTFPKSNRRRPIP